MKILGNALFWILLVLLAVLAANFFLQDPGQVRVRYGGTDYSTSIPIALAGLLGVFALVVLAWNLLVYPFRAWRAHSDRRGRARFGEGLDALNYGQYERAEKLLAQAAAEDDSIAVSARLAAARAARWRGDTSAARAQIDALGDRHAVARAIALAEQALREGRSADALVALDVPAAQPLPPRGLALRADALAAAGHSDEAYGLLGSLRKQHALPNARLDELQLRWAEGALREAADANALADRWQALPKPLKTEPDVALAYAERAQTLGWDQASIKAVEQALDTHWDERLAARYAAISSLDPGKRQATLERWSRTYNASPTLELALARSYREQGRWPEAQSYLQRALNDGAPADAWEELGNGYVAAGDEVRARISYGNALRATRGEAPLELPPDPSSQAPGSIVTEERNEHGLPRLRE